MTNEVEAPIRIWLDAVDCCRDELANGTYYTGKPSIAGIEYVRADFAPVAVREAASGIIDELTSGGLDRDCVEKILTRHCSTVASGSVQPAAVPPVSQGVADGGEWQPISTAPKDGSRILCWAPDFNDPCFLVWKTNPRIVHAHGQGQSLELATSYFGDPNEMDDYDLAEADGGPTLWLPIPAPALEVVEKLGAKVK